ncbi:MAG: HAMP domain-containing protein [Anaerolineae bacterium]|nr:HAMP domain-containing protein [Anaerolineae bacterium]
MRLVARAVEQGFLVRLIGAFVAIIMVTTIAAGVPAYALVRAELESQAWARVADGGRVTLALLHAEQARLANLASLAAQRPTLRGLLAAGNGMALSDYVRDFQASIGLDILIVRDGSGYRLTDDVRLPAMCEGLPLEVTTTFCVVTDPVPSLALLAHQAIRDGMGATAGYVTVGVLFDAAFAQQLAGQTGLDQSIIVAGERAATSLADPGRDFDAALFAQAMAATQTTRITTTVQDRAFYAVLLPLHDLAGAPVCLVEVALSADDVAAAENQALLVLVCSTLLVLVAGSVFAGVFARRLTSPLRQLTTAARRISQGDFTTPVPVIRAYADVATLARGLEESRVNVRRALADLSHAKAWSEALIQSIVEGIVTYDAEGRITFFSQGAERITGWPGELALGAPLGEVFRLAEDTGPFLDLVPAQGGKAQVGVLNRQDSPMTLAVTSARLLPQDGGAMQTALVLRDITEEEAVQHLRAYFLANITHEFRTPLAALTASVELLLDEVGRLSPDEMGELLNSIHLSVTGLQTLIDNLLESISIEAGHFSIRRRPCDLRQVIAESVQIMQPLLNRRRQQLSLALPDDLPVIDADPTRLAQVVVNLLSNASKYSPMRCAIDLSLDFAAPDLLRLVVADQGPGISQAERASIFRQFVRASTQDEGRYGIGIGLSVVKAIVEGHGGEVGVDERPGGGSCFWFTIPLAAEDPATGRARRQ